MPLLKTLVTKDVAKALVQSLPGTKKLKPAQKVKK